MLPLLRAAAWTAVCSQATQHVTLRNMVSGRQIEGEIDFRQPLATAAAVIAKEHGVHQSQIALFNQNGEALVLDAPLADVVTEEELLYTVLRPPVSPEDLDDPESAASKLIKLTGSVHHISLWGADTKDRLTEIRSLAQRFDGWDTIDFARLFPEESGWDFERFGGRRLEAFLGGLRDASPDSLADFFRGTAGAETPLERARRILRTGTGLIASEPIVAGSKMFRILVAHGALAELDEQALDELLQELVDHHLRTWDIYDNNIFVMKPYNIHYKYVNNIANAYTLAAEAVLAQGVDPSATEAGRRALGAVRQRLRYPESISECLDCVFRPISYRRMADRHLMRAMRRAVDRAAREAMAGTAGVTA